MEESIKTNETISDIVDLAFKCPDYRKLERECLRSVEEYSCSDETREAIEDIDPTGNKLASYISNQDECDEHERVSQAAYTKHVTTCTMEGCMRLSAYRKSLGVKGY